VVKTYGLLRTGTNYMTRLVEINYRALCLGAVEGSWKHGPCAYDPHLKYVFLVKDPYSWIVSFLEWERIHGRFCGRSLSEFLATPVTHPQLRRVWGCEDVISAWNESLRSWKTLSETDNVVFVRYEDLLQSFERELRRVSESLGLAQRGSRLANLDERADTWNTPKPRKKLSREYYQNAEYLREFSESDLEMMRQRLDFDLVRAFGYRLV